MIDFIRRRNRTIALTEDENGDSSDAFFDRRGNWKPELRSALCRPLDSLEREEFRCILRACLDELPTRQPDVFVRREMKGQSTGEICKALEITASNAWVLLHRARRRLAITMNSRWQQQASK